MRTLTLKILLWLLRHHPDVANIDVMTVKDYERWFAEEASPLSFNGDL